MQVPIFGAEVEIQESYIDAPPSEVEGQLMEYLGGKRRAFDLPIRYESGFTGEVQRAIQQIPYGATRSYADLAELIGSAPRAVGGGCGRNPIPIIVPCHRVIRSDGGLGGFSAGGDRGVDLKRTLLEFEAGVVHSSDSRDSPTVRPMST